MAKALMQYFGGKFHQAPWIVSHFPSQDRIDCYCEPFCGAANVFLRYRPRYAVLNDLYDEIYNLFEVLKSANYWRELARLSFHTIKSRKLFAKAVEFTDVPVEGIPNVERAYYFLVRQWFSISGIHPVLSSNYSVKRKGYTSYEFLGRVMLFRQALIASNASIENLDGCKCISLYDSAKTLFYVDPPYISEVRRKGLVYRPEIKSKSASVEYHSSLIDVLLSCKGMAAISTYENDLYNRLLDNGWKIVKKEFPLSSDHISSKKDRVTECLYLNPQLVEATSLDKDALFGVLYAKGD